VRGSRTLSRNAQRQSILIALSFLFLFSISQASDSETGDSYTGVKFGLIGSGRVDVVGRRIDQRSGLSAGFFFDQPFGSRLHYSLSADLMKMAWRERTPCITLEESEWLLDLGVNLKGNFVSENRPLGFRPGVGVGAAFLGRMEMAGVSSSSYLTLRAFAEIVYFSPGDLMFLLESGVWYAPSGGDNATDVSMGPLFTLRGGVMF